MLRVLPPMFKPVLHEICLLQGSKSCCRKERVLLLFATKFVHVARLAAKGIVSRGDWFKESQRTSKLT